MYAVLVWISQRNSFSAIDCMQENSSRTADSAWVILRWCLLVCGAQLTLQMP
jgi:hypothetical protein